MARVRSIRATAVTGSGSDLGMGLADLGGTASSNAAAGAAAFSGMTATAEIAATELGLILGRGAGGEAGGDCCTLAHVTCLGVEPAGASEAASRSFGVKGAALRILFGGVTAWPSCKLGHSALVAEARVHGIASGLCRIAGSSFFVGKAGMGPGFGTATLPAVARTGEEGTGDAGLTCSRFTGAAVGFGAGHGLGCAAFAGLGWCAMCCMADESIPVALLVGGAAAPLTAVMLFAPARESLDSSLLSTLQGGGGGTGLAVTGRCRWAALLGPQRGCGGMPQKLEGEGFGGGALALTGAEVAGIVRPPAVHIAGGGTMQ